MSPQVHNLDHIFLEGFDVSCKVGDSPEERAFPQVLRLHIDIYLSLKEASRNDDISKTVNYAKIVEEIPKIIQANDFVLVETVAETVATFILRDERVNRVRVKLSKKVFPEVQSVGVTIVREKN